MTAFMRTPTMPNRQRRSRVVFTLLALVGLLVGWRLVSLQVFKHDWIVKRSVRQARHVVEIPGPRGEIVDRRGRIMAISIPMRVLVVKPNQISRDGLRAIERVVGARPGRLTNKQDDPWEIATDRCDTACQKKIEALIENGVFAQAAIHWDQGYPRSYPHGELAAHVLGFVNSEGKGAEGLELKHDLLLRSSREQRRLVVDGKQRVIESDIEAVGEASRLMLTIDLRVQAALEEQLREAREQHGARYAQGVVLDPKTGDVLALATQPSFDPNSFWRVSSADAHRNRVIEKPRAPGSVIKPLTAAALLEEGSTSSKDIVHCENGKWRVMGHTVRDTHPHGWLTLPQIIEVSSNIGIAKLAREIPKKAHHDTLRALGLGERTGIELPAEKKGLLRGPDEWGALDHEAISYGYSMRASTLQIARAYGALANQGVLIEPRIVRAWGSPDGRWHRTSAPARRRAVSRATARSVTRWMENVIAGEHGTGSAAAVDGYRIAGKTGTAEKHVAGGFSERKNFVTFAGFGPADDPAAVVVISLDEPHLQGRTAGAAAAPAFANVMKESLRLMQIPPEGGNRLHVQEVSQPSVGGRE